MAFVRDIPIMNDTNHDIQNDNFSVQPSSIKKLCFDNIFIAGEKAINESHIKNRRRGNPATYRPISLLNTIYKILAAAIVQHRIAAHT